jgi:hypothetical protein
MLLTLNLQDQAIKVKVIRKGERVQIILGPHTRGIQEFNRATLWAWIRNTGLRYSSEQVLPEEGTIQIEKALKLIIESGVEEKISDDENNSKD